ncbi:MAG: hypothetical protein M1818_008016 [Claussenomyces sp. TS43310]|nr:MAG: hypothetical protein M1818_008016 [Claussenomyces sp. TS43310]
MLGKLLLLSTASALAYTSSPLRLGDPIPYVFTNSFGLNFTQMNASLPNVTIFATGGTIAGSASSNTATTGYTAGAVGILTLINAVPELLNISNIAGVQISNVASEDVTSNILLSLSKMIHQVVCDDPTMSAAIVTHGTDTLEETAFFLDATVNCDKPVIIVGAMRPSTAISSDGPYNLLEAVTVGVSPKAKHRGAMVVMNDRIVSAYYVTKTNANTMDTFRAPEMGNLGELISDTPYFFYPPVEPTGKLSYDISNVTKIPRVDILFAYEDMHNDTLYNAIDSGAKGFVIAGAGAGGVSTSFNYAIEDVVNRLHIPIVQSFRTGSGEVPLSDVGRDTAPHIASGYLNPQKSRILLGLLLALDKNITEIAAAADPQRPGPQRANSQRGNPARRSEIRGPQSALTDFLASHNISANQIRLDADQRRAAALASTQGADDNNEDAASPQAEAESSRRPARRNESKAQEKKRKMEEGKAIEKIKASKQFQRRRKGYDPEELTDEDEAAREIYEQYQQPLPGQMENCEICDKRFTVTAYSRAGPGGGLLCPQCTKELNDEEGTAKKRRKVTGGRRRAKASNLLDGTYQRGARNLMTLCLETLAKNVDLAEDLGDMPPNLVHRLAMILSKRRLLTPNTLNLFLRPGSDTVTVFEGAKLSSDDYIRIFQTVPAVKHLRLQNAIQFKNRVMDYLIGCPTVLESFSIHGANLIDDERWNTYLTKKGNALRTLKVYHTDGHFGDEQLEQLGIASPDLVRLKISHNQKITDAGVKHIAALSNLKHLTLELYDPPTSEPCVEVLNKIGHGLKTLCLSNIPYLDDSVLEAIHSNCTQLNKLRLAENEVFTDAAFAQLFTNWSNPPLTRIDLHKCRHVDAALPRDNPDGIGLCSAGFEALMAHSGSSLRHLNLHACRHISSDAFERVFPADHSRTYPDLQTVDVSFCWAVNDFVVGCIFRCCPALKTLKVFGNFGVRDIRVPKGKILIGMPNAVGMQIEGEAN